MIKPDKYDVVVIGGGLLGALVTLFLAKRSVNVLLLEKDQINRHASGQNAGSLHYQLEYRMLEKGLEAAETAASAMPLHLKAAKQWAMLSEEIGCDLGWKQTGGLMLAENSHQLELLGKKIELEKKWGLDVELYTGSALHKIAPYLSESVIGASFCPLEGKANSRQATVAVTKKALLHHARIEVGQRVTGVQFNGNNWTLDIVDDSSCLHKVFAQKVVLAAGIWTTELSAIFGYRIPTTVLGLMMNVSVKTEHFIPHLVQHAGARLSLKQSEEGNLLIGGGWPSALQYNNFGQVNVEAPPKLIESSLINNLAQAARVVPRTQEITLLRSWVGATTIAPDQLPIVGELPNTQNVYLATGGSAFTLGPSFAEVLSQKILGDPVDIDLTPYSPSRLIL